MKTQAIKFLASKVRLSQREIDVLQKTAALITQDWEQAELWLFGSRTDLAAKGGDIDLLLWINANIENPRQIKRSFQNKVHEALGEQKIDLLLVSLNHPETAFAKLARLEGVRLWTKEKL